MAGKLTEIMAAVGVRLSALGFTATDEAFDFDHTPASIIDGAYRVAAVPIANTALTSNGMIASWSVEVFVCYNVHRNPSAVYAKAQDDREAIENDLLMNKTVNDLAVVLPDEKASMAKYHDAFLVSKIALRFDFVRKLAA